MEKKAQSQLSDFGRMLSLGSLWILCDEVRPRREPPVSNIPALQRFVMSELKVFGYKINIWRVLRDGCIVVICGYAVSRVAPVFGSKAITWLRGWMEIKKAVVRTTVGAVLATAVQEFLHARAKRFEDDDFRNGRA